MPTLLTKDQIHQLALRAMLVDEETHGKKFIAGLRIGDGPDASVRAYEIAVRAVREGSEASTDHAAIYLAYMGWPMAMAIVLLLIWLEKWSPWAEWIG